LTLIAGFCLLLKQKRFFTALPLGRALIVPLHPYSFYYLVSKDSDIVLEIGFTQLILLLTVKIDNGKK
jgi:hypothetical protein